MPAVRLGATHLHDPAEVAVGRQLQPLLLRPGFHAAQLLADDGPPVVRAEAGLGAGDQPVEQPHVDEVEELGEELDGEGGVDPAAPQQAHGARERVQDVVCGGGRGGHSVRLPSVLSSDRGREGDTCPRAVTPRTPLKQETAHALNYTWLSTYLHLGPP